MIGAGVTRSPKGSASLSLLPKRSIAKCEDIVEDNCLEMVVVCMSKSYIVWGIPA